MYVLYIYTILCVLYNRYIQFLIFFLDDPKHSVMFVMWESEGIVFVDIVFGCTAYRLLWLCGDPDGSTRRGHGARR